MKLRFSNITAATLSIIAMGSSLLFIRSFIRYDELQWYAVRGEASFWIASSRGEICINSSPDESADHDVEPGWYWHSSKPMSLLVLMPDNSMLERFGFGVIRDDSGRGWRGSILVLLPDWPLLLATWLYPLARLNQWRLRRRRDRRLLMRLCPYCSYDLRASGETCPECGFH